jgi:hypothetical protein
MAAVTTAAIFRGCRTFAGFASFAKSNGTWLNLCGTRCEACGAAYRRTLSRIDSNGLLEEFGGFFTERVEAILAAFGFSAREKRVLSCDSKQSATSGESGAKKTGIMKTLHSKPELWPRRS